MVLVMVVAMVNDVEYYGDGGDVDVMVVVVAMVNIDYDVGGECR